jgi:bifunctional enzyme CysN/CysC
MAVTFTLEDEIDISRGDMLVSNEKSSIVIADKFKATIVWMAEAPLTPGRQYLIKLGTRSVFGSVSIIHHRIAVNTLEHHDATELKLNQIGSCTLTVNAPVVFDAYKINRATGAFIIIDRLTNGTVGAGMISGSTDSDILLPVSATERAARFSQRATTLALTGTARKDIACKLERKLFDNGHASTVLETKDACAIMQAIKDAGLICLCVNSSADLVDISFDTDTETLDGIYDKLKQEKIIY